MDFVAFYHQFLEGLWQTTALEAVAVISGIASVILSRAGNIWVYPIGLINTVIYVYLSFKGHLLGEASVNIYYTILSIYGWILWARRNDHQEKILHITFSNRREWVLQLGFGTLMYVIIFVLLTYLKDRFASGAIPWADAFASATAYTGMWLMARKKVESWWWWIATDLASIPLYAVKGYAFSSVQFTVFTALAVMGLVTWQKKATNSNAPVIAGT